MKRYLIAIGYLALAACSNAPTEPDKSETVISEQLLVTLSDQQLQHATIETGLAKQQNVSSTLTVNGQVDVPPQNIVSVSFPMGGYLKSTELLPGMRVRKGQVIGTIEDQSLIQLQQDYLVAKTRLEYLKQDFDRQRLLNEQKVNADKVWQQATADFNSQQVLVKGYAEKLQLVGINPQSLSENTLSRSVALRSPINGYVSKVNINIGKYVNPTDVLFELINPDDMHGALTVFEKDMSKIRVGQKVEMRFVDEPDQVYPGDVIIFSRNVDENRSGMVHCHFDQMPDHLMPGMFLNATIFLNEQLAFTVPEEAVVRFSGKDYVFVSDGKNRFIMTEVNIAEAQDKRIAVFNDTIDWEKQTIVVKNAYAVLGQLKNTAED